MIFDKAKVFLRQGKKVKRPNHLYWTHLADEGGFEVFVLDAGCGADLSLTDLEADDWILLDDNVAEQEKVKKINSGNYKRYDEGMKFHICGNCETGVDEGDTYCRECGKNIETIYDVKT